MLAVPERVPGHGQNPDLTIWHKPIGRVVEEFQAIACSEDEGINMPGAKTEVPLRLAMEHESWCTSCLATIRRNRSLSSH